MTLFMLNDGWRDESTEGPYTETLQTLGNWQIFRGHLPRRTGDKYRLKYWGTNLSGEFDTIEEAKKFVADFNAKVVADTSPNALYAVLEQMLAATKFENNEERKAE